MIPVTQDFLSALSIKLSSWYNQLLLLLPDLLLALAVFSLFVLLSKYVSRLVKRIAENLTDNISLQLLLASVARFVVLAVGFFFALGLVGLDKTVTSLLAGAGVVALAIGFAFQDLTANFISGTFLTIQRPIQIGDTIETNGILGRVKAINLRSVTLTNFAGQEIEIPSKDIFQKTITNFTKTDEFRVQIDCGVSYSDDLSLVEQTALETIRGLPFVLSDPGVMLHFTEFGDSSINLMLRFWIKPSEISFLVAKSEGIKALKSAFDAKGITIPFPIRTLELAPSTGQLLSTPK